MEVKNIETEIEKSLTIKWKMRQSSLFPDQEKFVNKIVDFLIKNPDASIDVYPIQYADKEKEYIRFFEAKKKYFLLSRNSTSRIISKDDSLTVDKMSVKDASFVHYLNTKNGSNMLFTIQEKCDHYVGKAIVDAGYKKLNNDRERSFVVLFKNKSVQKTGKDAYRGK